jgi:hypothetical protein
MFRRRLAKEIGKGSEELRREVREKTVGYITAALGLVAGLAWNEAIKAFIEHLFPLQKDTLVAKLFYAVAITLVVVFLSIYLMRLVSVGKEKEESK